MLYSLPTVVVIFVYLLAALLPALLLMRYVYRKDTIEKEPAGLLVGLVFLGAAAALVAIVLGAQYADCDAFRSFTNVPRIAPSGIAPIPHTVDYLYVETFVAL